MSRLPAVPRAARRRLASAAPDRSPQLPQRRGGRPGGSPRPPPGRAGPGPRGGGRPRPRGAGQGGPAAVSGGAGRAAVVATRPKAEGQVREPQGRLPGAARGSPATRQGSVFFRGRGPSGPRDHRAAQPRRRGAECLPRVWPGCRPRPLRQRPPRLFPSAVRCAALPCPPAPALPAPAIAAPR